MTTLLWWLDNLENCGTIGNTLTREIMGWLSDTVTDLNYNYFWERYDR